MFSSRATPRVDTGVKAAAGAFRYPAYMLDATRPIGDPRDDAPETVKEEPERAEPRSSTGGPQESAERPPDTAEWPVRGALLRPWWRRVFGG